MMTKKDFDAIAKVTSHYYHAPGMDKASIKLLTNALADVYAESNPRFDRDRFFQACYLETK